MLLASALCLGCGGPPIHSQAGSPGAVPVPARSVEAAPASSLASRPPLPERRAPESAQAAPELLSEVKLTPLTERRYGAQEPLVFDRAAPDGSWLSYCTVAPALAPDATVSAGSGASEPFALTNVFVSGVEERVGVELLVAHPLGRWVALRQADSAWLEDLKTGQRWGLPALHADLRADRARYLPHRALVFHPSLPLFAYFRRTEGETEVVLRALESGREVHASLGASEVYRAAFATDENSLVLQVLREDTNGNGRLDWPVPEAATTAGCKGRQPLSRLPAHGPQGDAVSFHWLRFSQLPELEIVGAVDVPGLIAPFLERVLYRTSDGRVWLGQWPHEGGQGQALEVGDKDCVPRIWHVDAARDRVLFACMKDNPVKLSELKLFTGGRVQGLGVELRPLGPDRSQEPTRLVPIYPGAGAALFDAEDGRLHLLQEGDGVVATFEGRALLLRRRRLLLWEAGRFQDLGVLVERLPFVLTEGPLAVVTKYLVSLEAGRVLGEVRGRSLAISLGGQVLVADGRPASAQELAVGPLSWASPVEPGAGTP